MKDIRRALEQLVPNFKWDYSIPNEGGNESQYNAIIWKDDRPKPTWAEIEAACDLFDIPTKEELLTQINQAVNQYIYQYYDAGTQLSFNALYVHPATSQEMKTALESVWAWIQAIMVYYYTQKAGIEAETVTSWDFTQFGTTKPDVTLAALMA